MSKFIVDFVNSSIRDSINGFTKDSTGKDSVGFSIRKLIRNSSDVSIHNSVRDSLWSLVWISVHNDFANSVCDFVWNSIYNLNEKKNESEL